MTHRAPSAPSAPGREVQTRERNRENPWERLWPLANCLEYPREDTREGALRAAGRFEPDQPEVAEALRGLAAWLGEKTLGEAREVYTNLFDLSPVCTLNIGHHLWGDTYQRGAFLAELAREMKERRLDTGAELPDYLPLVLRLLERINDAEDLEILVGSVLGPALHKMDEKLQGSSGEHLPWARILGALLGLFEGFASRRRPPADPLHVINGSGFTAPKGGGCPRA